MKAVALLLIATAAGAATGAIPVPDGARGPGLRCAHTQVLAYRAPGNVYAQRYNSAGLPLGGEFRVNTYTSSDQEAPSVAMDQGGEFVVAWKRRARSERAGLSRDNTSDYRNRATSRPRWPSPPSGRRVPRSSP